MSSLASIRRFGSSRSSAPIKGLRAIGFLALLAIVAIGCSSADGLTSPEATGSSTTDSSTRTASSASIATTSAPASTSASSTTATAPSTTATPFQVEAAAWTDCFTGLHCAAVAVPLDHAVPDGERIEIAMARVPAADEPLGTIFVNLGGPGGSAINSIRNGFRLDEETMARYHLVGFDPRGIGRSSPLACEVNLTAGPRPDFSPDDAVEVSALDEQAKALAAACGESDGLLLPHLSTDSVVADLDLLRQAVGDPELHYIGLSYGTMIGLRYAERFPGLVGHIVLDGVVDPSFSLIDLLRQQALAFEQSFENLDQACGAELSCPSDGLTTTYDRLSQRFDETGPDGGVGSAELEIATLIAMYSENLWQRYASALADADRGDPTELGRLHDLYVGGISFAAYLAVSCIDSPSPIGAENWDAAAAELSELAPRFGATLANEVRSCAHWPTPAVGTPGPVSAPGSKPILVLSTSGDAATPLANAVKVAEMLASAGLVIVDDAGHTAYGKSQCARAAVAEYFDSGVVPSEILRC